MTMSLYEELGISSNADDKAIKKAYRDAAKLHHPDKGGERAKFDRIQHAFQILSDPVRRQRYDATGDASEVRPDNSQALLIQNAVQYILMALAKFQNVNPENIDVVTEAKKLIDESIHKIHENKSAMSVAADRAERAAKRIKRKIEDDAPNLIVAALNGHAKQIRDAIERCDKDIEAHRAAREFLEKYSFDAILMVNQQQVWTFGHTSTNSTWR